MNTRGSFRNDYGWPEVERDLADGVHPEVVAARIGEPIAYLLEVADDNAWPIRWEHTLPTPDETLERFNRLYGLDA